jgi:Tol biopolymer transport system component
VFVGMKGDIDLWTVDLDGSNLKQLTKGQHVNNPSCSPDSSLVYFSNAPGTQLYTVPIAGGAATEAKGLPTAGYIFFSPDGKLAGYVHGSAEDHYRPHCGLIDLATGKKLGDFSIALSADTPRFSRDGKSIQYLLTRNGARNLWDAPIAGGEAHPITNFSSGDASGYAWSPDGKQLYMSRGVSKSDVVLITNFH